MWGFKECEVNVSAAGYQLEGRVTVEGRSFGFGRRGEGGGDDSFVGCTCGWEGCRSVKCLWGIS